MELLQNQQYFIVQNGNYSLWCSRENGSLTPKRDADINGEHCMCLGKVYGVLGKLSITQDGDYRLILIRQQRKVGTLPGCSKPVYVINKILLLPLNQMPIKEIDIELCEHHHNQTVQTTGPQKSLQKTWNQLKTAAENIKPKKLPFRILPSGEHNITSSQTNPKDVKEKEKFERRILEELTKMFTDSESFYYCSDGDLTNSIQRQQTSSDVMPNDLFFWNKHMMHDIINADLEVARPWLVPVIQGYVQIEECPVTFDDDDLDPVLSCNGSSRDLSSPACDLTFKLCLISRRSRHRAGTRYKRRGIDDEGNTANYVETEQILEFANHIVSFVQVRGSVPLFWSQTGIKYKPPPKIERDEPSNREAFGRHFTNELANYSTITVVSLVDQIGKEKVIADAYLSHIITFNHPNVTYVAFDFHEYCRGMQFENVNILTENIMDIIRDMRYCWVDNSGTICEQRGVFRVNCIDCLDRTNIVQSAIARIVLEVQCRKLGLLSPERRLAAGCRVIYQQMWANNGDTISRQYAGTAALKGDYTRTGERRFTGMMKDGVNSANRYYINRVKDVYRQATIDLMLGNMAAEELVLLRNNKLDATNQGSGVDEEDGQVLVEKEENLKTLIDECKKMLISEPEECLGGWGLIDCDPDSGDPLQQDMDIILLLSQKAYYVARYDDDTDQVVNYQRILLDDLDRIEIGVMSHSKGRHPMCIRIHYQRTGRSNQMNETHDFFHTFCSTGTRLFNNIVITIHNQDEARESLRAIAETFVAAKKLNDQTMTITDIKLDKKPSCPPASEIIDIACQAQQQVESTVPPPPAVSRGSSFSNLSQLTPEATRRAIEVVLDTTAQSSSKLLEFGRSVVNWRSHPPQSRCRPTGVIYHSAAAAAGSSEHLEVSSSVHSADYDTSPHSLHNSEDGADNLINFTEYEKTETLQNQSQQIAQLDQQMAQVDLVDDKKNGLHNFNDVDSSEQSDIRIVELESDETTADSLNALKYSAELETVDSSTNSETATECDRKCDTWLHKTVTAVEDNNLDLWLGVPLTSTVQAPPAIVLEDGETSSGRVHPAPLCRRHSLMKMSHSEGSLSSNVALSVAPSLPTTSANDLPVICGKDDEFDLLDMASGAESGIGSGFARLLRGKMVALAVPRGTTAVSLAASNRRQLEDLARSRLAKSQLRFKECQSRILLM